MNELDPNQIDFRRLRIRKESSTASTHTEKKVEKTSERYYGPQFKPFMPPQRLVLPEGESKLKSTSSLYISVANSLQRFT